MKRRLLFIAFMLAACAPPTTPTPTAIPSPTAALAPTVTAVPPTSTTIPVTCADLDVAWAAADWAMALQVLDRLLTANLACGENTLDSKRYAVHINYAVSLENTGDVEAAVVQYQAALAINGRGTEALDALIRLNALPTPTTPPCNLATLEPYTSSATFAESFVTVHDDQLSVNGVPFLVRGLNYYPRHAPWDRFLTDSDLTAIEQEFDLIEAAGFNTLRIFLWYDPLFTCAPEDAVPNPATFIKLDKIIELASERNLRLIVTLNDLPDLLFRPLYTDFARYDAQTAFIVKRYRDEAAILAWDLRNEGDIDYGAHPSFPKRFEQDVVLSWLRHATETVRANDTNHLITAGWWGNAVDTTEVADVLSFHHWTTSFELNARIESLKAASTKPILVEEIGYSSWGDRDEAGQAQALRDAIAIAENSGIAGWLVWTAFDFTPSPGQPANIEHFFGVWHTDLTPKPALETLPLPTAP